MAEITQFIAGLGYGGRRYDLTAMADKAAAATPAETITQFFAGLGYGGRRYNLVAMADKTGTIGGGGDDYIIRYRRRRGR